jgi:predicted nuclease of predicted toxin-antitoxin system
VKALLDEQLSPRIAELLREAGYDVVAVAERVELIGSADAVLLEIATSEGRAVITNNVKDFRPLAAEFLARGRAHGGLILSRVRTREAVVPLAAAIERLLHDHPDGLASSERWVGPL